MSMREKIAQAIHDNGYVDMPSAEQAADAVLDVLMEPTEGMISAADKQVRPDSDNMQCPDFYRAMIKAAKDGE